MAAPLKDSFGPEVAVGLADLRTRVDPSFAAADFVAAASPDFAELELADRSCAVAAALARYLPADPTTAIILLSSGHRGQRRGGDRVGDPWATTVDPPGCCASLCGVLAAESPGRASRMGHFFLGP